MPLGMAGRLPSSRRRLKAKAEAGEAGSGSRLRLRLPVLPSKLGEQGSRDDIAACSSLRDGKKKRLGY